ncbi:hypothetical protein [Streptomyces sp. NBC_01334]|uniref:hypothetical protein n=1 Tax=Streptomyces sp. NBC_01334 TaxID=2903827 RepID=UPI002E0F3E3C|nr:hypothetical protein OG736_02790 [Streptomyces sp. NBC_01334]
METGTSDPGPPPAEICWRAADGRRAPEDGRSPDGSLLATGDFNGKVILWDTTGPERVVRRACARLADAGLSPSDWKRYANGTEYLKSC